jgi:hypothetical protein
MVSFGCVRLVGSVQIVQSVTKLDRKTQNLVIQGGVDRLLGRLSVRTPLDTQTSLAVESYYGDICCGSNATKEIKIEQSMIRLFDGVEIELSHHFNAISIAIVDATFPKLFCYLANGSIKTRHQAFPTVGGASRRLFVVEFQTMDQVRLIAAEIDARFRGRDGRQGRPARNPRAQPSSSADSYLEPIGNDKVLVPAYGIPRQNRYYVQPNQAS